MTVSLTVNGVIYQYPEEGDTQWGQVTTQWATAVTSGMLQKAGGTFTLTANVDFGATFGLVSSYFSSRSGNVSQTGAVRLANSNAVAWRDSANATDLLLNLSGTDKLQFASNELLTSAYSSIVNANISASAAIALSKLAAVTASRSLVSDASGFVSASSVTSTELGYLSGVTSAIQTQFTGKLSLTGGSMSGALLLSADPSVSSQAATKQYVDNAMLGLQPKASCLLGTTANITLSGEQTIDGVLTSASRVLVKNQTLPANNGIYVSAAGAWARATDLDTWAEALQAYTLITLGSTQAGSGWLSNASAGGTLGTTSLLFNQFSSSTVYSADGQGIELSGTQFSLELDGTTLSKSSSGVRVGASTISDIAAKLPITITTTGDLIYSSSGTTASRLAIGTTGQVLTVVSGLPAWVTQNPTVVAVSGTVTLVAGDSNKVYLVDTSATRTFNLPAPAAGLNFYIKDKTGQCATNNITVVRNGSEQIEGIAASKTFQTNWGSWRVLSDGTNWFVL